MAERSIPDYGSCPLLCRVLRAGGVHVPVQRLLLLLDLARGVVLGRRLVAQVRELEHL